MARKRKVRVDFNKNRESRVRHGDYAREYQEGGDHADSTDELSDHESVRGKGRLSRKRTVMVDDTGTIVVNAETARGRVISSHGLYCDVAGEDGQVHRCFTRRLLKSLSTDERNVLTTGDWVRYKPAPGNEGLILAVEPRRRVLTRRYRQREHVIVANVDQVLIVAALVEPMVKPHLIDRYLFSCEQGHMRPIICFNKVDLVAGWRAVPLIGLYSQLGYPVVLTSAREGRGIDTLRQLLAGRETVIVGQSGVGKSSLLNALDPQYHLRVSAVSEVNDKGRHTTTTSQLLRLREGGSVVDTPGIRQFELWEASGQIDGYFPELRAFAAVCRFPGCTHTHEDECAVKAAVAGGYVTVGRYESYTKLLAEGRGEEV